MKTTFDITIEGEPILAITYNGEQGQDYPEDFPEDNESKKHKRGGIDESFEYEDKDQYRSRKNKKNKQY
jgi:hypothetical protein